MSNSSVASSQNLLQSSEYHPDFTDVPVGQDTVVTLVSRDGMRFRASSNALKAASGFFATTLSLPQPRTCPKEAVIDNLDEDAPTIEGLLRMITAKECPCLDTLEVIQPLLLAAEKWDMPGPSSILKMFLLQNSSIVSDHPLRLYWLGTYLGWEGMTKMASKFSCNSHIFYSPSSQQWLQALGSTDLTCLMKLHRTRRDLTKAYLESGKLVSPDCPRKLSPFTQTHTYQAFKWQFLEQMDFTPPGCSVGEDVLREMFTSLQLETAQCPTCTGKHWSTIKVLARIKEHWSALLQTV